MWMEQGSQATPCHNHHTVLGIIDRIPRRHLQVELASADSLKWSFGTSVETVRHGYTLQLQTDASGGSKSWKRVAVTAIAGECSGTCKDDGSVIALQLTSQSLASIVYRLMDDDSA